MLACKNGTCEHLFYVGNDENVKELAQLKGSVHAAKGSMYSYFCKGTPRCKKIGEKYNWGGYQTPSWCTLGGDKAFERENAAAEKPATVTIPQTPAIVMIGADKIIGSLNNFYSIGDLDNLAASIEMFGLKQPLLVKELSSGDYELISGHRRLAACNKLAETDERFNVLPCIIERGENAEDVYVKIKKQQK